MNTFKSLYTKTRKNYFPLPAGKLKTKKHFYFLRFKVYIFIVYEIFTTKNSIPLNFFTQFIYVLLKKPSQQFIYLFNIFNSIEKLLLRIKLF